ncbi:MAG TPA: OsmC family protein [Bradyrhizobium sp.]|uniref:OsmC family protein n=1 Tax=Bradyrhizobium sp. TaxID=376 RepID=UPI002CB5ACDF|nr:OsmC family protein [Bradyrhizobium sp.]HLZ02810.1 OsmC family protein [Bradyrhizobium sp.]
MADGIGEGSPTTNGKQHHYSVEVRWTGNLGEGTRSYQAYARTHDINSGRKPTIAGSSDPAFRGKDDRWNPEDLLVAAVSACHKLWYLHLCAVAGVNVVAYVDHAEGTMIEDAARGGYFSGVTLRPEVTVTPDSDTAKAAALHHDAHEKCFIANSLNFAIVCEPTIKRQA